MIAVRVSRPRETRNLGLRASRWQFEIRLPTPFRPDERKLRLKTNNSLVCRDDFARFSFSKCDVQAVVQGNAVAGGHFAGPRHQGEIGMQGGKVGSDRSVKRLR